jgi:signal transduction histidine kinase
MKNFVQFTVRDTGRGIEAERLSTIFDRFNPFSESGTGLGLALARRLVESLGGQIAVESRLGHGTTFRFTIPLAVAEARRHPVEVG